MLQEVNSKADEQSKEVMEHVMQEWEQKRRGGAFDMGMSGVAPETDVKVPLWQGEWDEPLGVPLCVVCHNVRRCPSVIGAR